MWTLINPEPIRRGTNTYRLYRCDCGVEREVHSHSVKTGRSTSCRTCEGLRRRKPDNYLAMAYLRHNYKRNAETRGGVWTLTDEEFVAITRSLCYYCHAEPSQVIRRKHAVYLYNGIDRKNNNLGYEMSNCLPCCKACNFAKRDLGYEAFMAWIQRIAVVQQNRKRKRT